MQLSTDWLIARLLDDPSIDNGRYGYSKSDRVKVEPRQTIDQYPFNQRAQVHQYAGDFAVLRGSRDLAIDFAGSTKAQMIDAQPHSGDYFMWSNRADTAVLRLQREFDLSNVKNATLKYWAWYDPPPLFCPGRGRVREEKFSGSHKRDWWFMQEINA